MNYEDLSKKTHEVADLMGWEVEENEHLTMCISIKKDEHELFIDCRGHGKKPDICEIRGLMPRDHDGKYVNLFDCGRFVQAPTIGCSLNKPASRIVKDIETRLFPKYLEHREKVQEIIDDKKSAADKKEAERKRLLEMGCTDYGRDKVTIHQYDKVSADITLTSEGIYMVEIRKAPKDTMDYILKLLLNEVEK